MSASSATLPADSRSVTLFCEDKPIEVIAKKALPYGPDVTVAEHLAFCILEGADLLPDLTAADIKLHDSRGLIVNSPQHKAGVKDETCQSKDRNEFIRFHAKRYPFTSLKAMNEIARPSFFQVSKFAVTHGDKVITGEGTGANVIVSTHLTVFDTTNLDNTFKNRIDRNIRQWFRFASPISSTFSFSYKDSSHTFDYTTRIWSANSFVPPLVSTLLNKDLMVGFDSSIRCLHLYKVNGNKFTCDNRIFLTGFDSNVEYISRHSDTDFLFGTQHHWKHARLDPTEPGISTITDDSKFDGIKIESFDNTTIASLGNGALMNVATHKDYPKSTTQHIFARIENNKVVNQKSIKGKYFGNSTHGKIFTSLDQKSIMYIHSESPYDARLYVADAKTLDIQKITVSMLVRIYGMLNDGRFVCENSDRTVFILDTENLFADVAHARQNAAVPEEEIDIVRYRDQVIFDWLSLYFMKDIVGIIKPFIPTVINLNYFARSFFKTAETSTLPPASAADSSNKFALNK